MEAQLNLTAATLVEGEDRVMRATYTGSAFSNWNSIHSVSLNLKLNDPIPRYIHVTVCDET